MSTVRDQDLPLPGDAESDARFTLGFVSDVHEVLRAHGYRPPEPGPDGDRSARNRAYGATLGQLHRLVRVFEGIEGGL